MAAPKEQIGRWFNEGQAAKKDFLIVACDTFDNEDYPVFAMAKDFSKEFKSLKGKESTEIMEVYDLHLLKGFQFREPRAWHLPKDVQEDEDQDNDFKEAAEMLKKAAKIGVSVSVGILHELAQNDQLFADIASMHKKSLQALLDEGFSREESLDIISHQSFIPNLNGQQAKQQ
jgi:hypothetical protein